MLEQSEGEGHGLCKRFHPRPALLLLHGGPGSTHNYFEVLDCLAEETGRAIVSYDQLGCGKSYVEGHPELWCAKTWVDELEGLIDALGLRRIHLLGQSWGGMLAITYLAEHGLEGVSSVILSSTLSDSQLWGEEQHRMARQLPSTEWEALMQAEETGDFSSPAYQQALDHYMLLHCADLHYDESAPECLWRAKVSGTESYVTAWGPNELTPMGTLAQWSYTDRLHELDLPALVISGTDDLCTPLIAKTMYDRLPQVTLQDVLNFERQNMAGKTFKYLILGDESDLDMNALEKIGPVHRLTTEEIFGY